MEGQFGWMMFDKDSICSPELVVIYKDFQTLTNRSEMYHSSLNRGRFVLRVDTRHR